MGERALVGTPYLADRALRAEYDRDIAPRTRAALAKILTEIDPPGERSARPRRIVDLGAGTGAAGEALRAHYGPEVNVIAVDRTAATTGVRVADVTDRRALATLGQADLVVAAHVLNELHVGDAADRRLERLTELVRHWCRVLLEPDGTLVLVEPALRETSRVLLAVRDRLVADGLHVVAPCFFAGPCPALLRERDWCHDTVPARAGNRRVDFSYLVLRNPREAVGEPALHRVVSDPLPEKGKLRLFVCGAEGRMPVIRLDRHGSTANAAFDRAARGDVLHLSRTAFARDGARILPESEVTLKRR